MAFPFMRPALMMRLGNSKIVGVTRIVRDEARYAKRADGTPVFPKGARVIELHVYSGGQDHENLKNALTLIKNFQQAIPRLRSMNIAGFVGHTPSAAIGGRFRQIYAMDDIYTTKEVDAEVRTHIDNEIRKSNFPVNLLTDPIMSIAKRFDQMETK